MGNQRVDTLENHSQVERGGLGVKFNTYRGGGGDITFFTLSHKLEK